jgi:hypothetical protein
MGRQSRIRRERRKQKAERKTPNIPRLEDVEFFEKADGWYWRLAEDQQACGPFVDRSHAEDDHLMFAKQNVVADEAQELDRKFFEAHSKTFQVLRRSLVGEFHASMIVLVIQVREGMRFRMPFPVYVPDRTITYESLHKPHVVTDPHERAANLAFMIWSMAKGQGQRNRNRVTIRSFLEIFMIKSGFDKEAYAILEARELLDKEL